MIYDPYRKNIDTRFQTNSMLFFPEHIFTSNVKLAMLYPKLMVLYIKALNGTDSISEIIKSRISNKLPLKIILDFSRETFNIDVMVNLQKDVPELNLVKDILLIHSAADVRSNTHIPLNFKTLPIDFYILETYYRCILEKESYDATPVSQRTNGLNLLIGKFKTRFCRFLTSYYFYKHNLLDSSVLGINAYPHEIEQMMKAHPEYYDNDYFNTIKKYLGPADNAVLHETNEGVTAATGWPFDPGIFNKSSATYICETFDMDRGYYPYMITEKFCRPIINRHPFVTQAAPTQIKLIQSLGFQTFSELISEDYNVYDHCHHNYEHVEKTVLAGKELVEKIPSNAELVQEIVNFNFDHFCKLGSSGMDIFKKEIHSFADENLT